VVAINAALQDAISVSAFDICPRAVHCARANALAAGVDVDVHLGSWARAVGFAPFDLVICNPPVHDGDDILACLRSGHLFAFPAIAAKTEGGFPVCT
jgi:release factor glutamine methyltransferase